MSNFQIKMLGTHRGSNDALTTKQYHKDCIYTVGDCIGDTLARRFIAQGWATEIDPQPIDDWNAFISRLDNSPLGKKSPVSNICRQFEEVFSPKNNHVGGLDHE